LVVVFFSITEGLGGSNELSMVIEYFVFLLTTAQELVKMWHAMVVWYKGEKVDEISVSIKNSAT